MSQAGSQAGGGSQVGGGSSSSSSSAPNVPGRPTFITTDSACPTIAKLGAYQMIIEQGVGQIIFLLDYLGDD